MPCSVQSPAHRAWSFSAWGFVSSWGFMTRASRRDPGRLIGERCPFLAARLPIRTARTCLRARAVNAARGRDVLPVLSSCLEAGHEFPVVLDGGYASRADFTAGFVPAMWPYRSAGPMRQ